MDRTQAQQMQKMRLPRRCFTNSWRSIFLFKRLPLAPPTDFKSLSGAAQYVASVKSGLRQFAAQTGVTHMAHVMACKAKKMSAAVSLRSLVAPVSGKCAA